MKADFEAEKQRLLADIEAKAQARTKALRDQLGQQLGVSKTLQAKIDELAADAERRALEAAKQTSTVQSLQTKLDSALTQVEQLTASAASGAAAQKPATAWLTSLLVGLGLPAGPAGLLAGLVAAIGVAAQPGI